MLVPKPIRKRIYLHLFNNGVMVAKKDLVVKHHELHDIQNLYVVKLMQSLVSRDLVKEIFNWQWHYYFLKNEGIEYLRGYLNLPEEIVPATLKKPKTAPREREQTRGDRSERPPRRTGPPGAEGEKKAAPSGDFKPEFRGPYGRGRGGAREGRPEGAARPEGAREGRDSYRREGGFSRGGGAPRGRGGDRQ